MDPIPETDGALPARGPLRLRLVERVGRDEHDGGWWPQSRDLAVELSELAEHLPSEYGRVDRVRCSPADWDSPPPRVAVRGGSLEVASLPHEDVHVIHLETHDQRVLRVLVVPPDLSADQGDEAMLAAASPGNTHSAAELLDTVTEHPDIDPADHWE